MGFKPRFEIAEVEITYKFGKIFSECEKINGSSCAYKIGLEISKDYIEHHECFNIILLNQANHILGVAQISEGGIAGTFVDIRIVYQKLLKANAVSFIALHNHPSGNINPSEADKKLTQKLKAAGETLDIKMLDHIIVTTNAYFSFADEGII
jgi:DNA repair protein RadC